MTVGVGDPAPVFELDGIDATGTATKRFRLDDELGQPVVLVFYPADNSPVCRRQLSTYTNEFDRFETVDARLLGISPQDVDSHRTFSRDQGGFAFPLLADVDKAVGEAYGVLGLMGFYKRSVFVLDEQGIIGYAHRATAGLGFRSTEEIVAAVREVSA